MGPKRALGPSWIRTSWCCPGRGVAWARRLPGFGRMSHLLGTLCSEAASVTHRELGGAPPCLPELDFSLIKVWIQNLVALERLWVVDQGSAVGPARAQLSLVLHWPPEFTRWTPPRRQRERQLPGQLPPPAVHTCPGHTVCVPANATLSQTCLPLQQREAEAGNAGGGMREVASAVHWGCHELASLAHCWASSLRSPLFLSNASQRGTRADCIC